MVYKRSQLNQGQIDILEVLYKYRYSSRQLLAETLGIKAGSSLHERLGVLVKHGLIVMHLEKQTKLLGMPGAYCLTPLGLRTLQGLPEHAHITNRIIKGSYKDSSSMKPAITRSLEVHRSINGLVAQYPTLKIFTGRELTRYDYFPKLLPDVFLSFARSDLVQPRRFFFDFIPDPISNQQLNRRITSYCTYFKSGAWNVTGSDLPRLLLLSASAPSERRIRRMVRASRARNETEELTVFTSNNGALTTIAITDAIWADLDEPDVRVTLAAI